MATKEFCYYVPVLVDDHSKDFRKFFEQGSYANIRPIYIQQNTGQRILYTLKFRNRGFIYPMLRKQVPGNKATFSRVNVWEIIHEYFEKVYREGLHKNKKPIRYKASPTASTVSLPSTYKDSQVYIDSRFQVENPEVFEMNGQDCELNVQLYNGKVTKRLVFKDGSIFMYVGRGSDRFDAEYVECGVLYASYPTHIKNLKCKELVVNHSTVRIDTLDCTLPCKIRFKGNGIVINKVVGDKSNLSLIMENSHYSEEDVQIEGKKFSDWKQKTHVKSVYPLKGKVFLATGKIIIGKYNTREQIYSLIKSAGGYIARNKDDSFDYLVTDKHFTHGDNTSAKLEEAESRGIIPISGAQLQEMLKNEGLTF